MPPPGGCPAFKSPPFPGPCSPPARLSLPGFHPAQGCRNQCAQAEDEGDAGSTISLERREGSSKCREAGSSLPGSGRWVQRPLLETHPSEFWGASVHALSCKNQALTSSQLHSHPAPAHAGSPGPTVPEASVGTPDLMAQDIVLGAPPSTQLLRPAS